MEAPNKQLRKKIFSEEYLTQINWDWLFLKGQIIFGGILLIGSILVLFWLL